MNKQLRLKLSRYLSTLRVAQDLHDDIIQDSWIRMSKAKTIIDYEKYAHTTVRNQAYNLLKKRNRFVALDTAFDISCEDDIVQARSDNRKLRELIGHLPTKQGQAIKGYYLEEKTYLELAKELGMSYNTVKANGRHGLMKLRKAYEEL